MQIANTTHWLTATHWMWTIWLTFIHFRSYLSALSHRLAWSWLEREWFPIDKKISQIGFWTSDSLYASNDGFWTNDSLRLTEVERWNWKWIWFHWKVSLNRKIVLSTGRNLMMGWKLMKMYKQNIACEKVLETLIWLL